MCLIVPIAVIATTLSADCLLGKNDTAASCLNEPSALNSHIIYTKNTGDNLCITLILEFQLILKQ